MQIRQALLLGLAYNLYRLRHLLAREDINRATVDYKRVEKTLNPLEATLTKIPGGARLSR
jgi:hypothetical protein